MIQQSALAHKNPACFSRGSMSRQGVENTWDEDQSAEVKRVVQGKWHKERKVQQCLHRFPARGDRGFGGTTKTRERRLKKEPPDIASNGSWHKKGI